MAVDWIRAEIRAAEGYTPSAAAGVPELDAKLDAMESPYDLDAGLKARWLQKLRDCEVNRYPSGQQALKEKLAKLTGLPPGCGLLFGNGSDELLQIVALAARGDGACLLSPTPGFSMYPIIARNCGLAFAGVALQAPDFALPRDAMLAEMERRRPALVWLAYPNNPTGNLWRRDDVDAVLDAAPGIVLMDEAYSAFASDSYWPSLGRRDNLLVSRTFSKVGLAGLRFGMLAGPADIIAELDKLRLPYNVNVLTGASVEFMVSQMDYFDARAGEICVERERLHGVLQDIAGVRPYPSEANFILLELTRAPAARVFDGLRARGILVKDFAGDEALGNCLRVTVGARAENDAFAAALRELAAQDGE